MTFHYYHRLSIVEILLLYILNVNYLTRESHYKNNLFCKTKLRFLYKIFYF